MIDCYLRNSELVEVHNLDPEAGSLAAAVGLDDTEREGMFFFDEGRLRLASNGSYVGVIACVNDDSTADENGDTCSDYYDDNPDNCGN